MKHQRDKFSIPRNVTYLNCAYMAPLLKSVEKAGITGIRRKRNPFDISAEDFFNEGDILRKEYAKVINAKDALRIVSVPSVSYGLAAVAKNVPLTRGDKVIVVAEQFPSNFYPWHARTLETGSTLQVIAPPDNTRIPRQEME